MSHSRLILPSWALVIESCCYNDSLFFKPIRTVSGRISGVKFSLRNKTKGTFQFYYLRSGGNLSNKFHMKVLFVRPYITSFFLARIMQLHRLYCPNLIPPPPESLSSKFKVQCCLNLIIWMVLCHKSYATYVRHHFVLSVSIYVFTCLYLLIKPTNKLYFRATTNHNKIQRVKQYYNIMSLIL